MYRDDLSIRQLEQGTRMDSVEEVDLEASDLLASLPPFVHPVLKASPVSSYLQAVTAKLLNCCNTV